MNLGEMETLIHGFVRDPILQQDYVTWINDALFELAMDYDFPGLKTNIPVELSCYASSYYTDMPSNFGKKLYRVWDSNSNIIFISTTTDALHDDDPTHTTSGSHIDKVAVFNKTGTQDAWQLMYYPRATETLKLFYYKRPIQLSAHTDTPDFIPSEYHRRVVVPKAIIRGYQLLGDMALDGPPVSLQYWEMQLQEGLYGRPGGGTGLINWFNYYIKPPKRHGGRNSLP